MREKVQSMKQIERKTFRIDPVEWSLVGNCQLDLHIPVSDGISSPDSKQLLLDFLRKPASRLLVLSHR